MSDKRAAAAPERQSVREEVFARDDHQCRLAPFFPDESCYGPLTVHHVKKASAGGSYTADNLVSACARHNDLVEERPAEAEALGLVKRWRPNTALLETPWPCPHCGSDNVDRGATGLDACNDCDGLSRGGKTLREAEDQ